MRRYTIMLLSFTTLTLLCFCIPGIARATTLTVSKICSNPSSTTCFTTVTAAINVANKTTNDNIIIEPGTYTESITLISNLPISGVETARTILQNSGSSTAVITANGLTSVSISNLTIVSASIGIQAVNSDVTIFNNVFWGNTQGTAILLQSNSSGQIFNNTFFQNQTAISSPVDITIRNNIFSTNSTALSAVGISQFTKVTNNDFHLNTNMGPFPYDQASTLETNIPNPFHTDPDPKFVKSNGTPPNMDLHLQEASPCIGTGSSAVDMGAFGGADADTIPFIISGVTLTSPSSGSIKVDWSANKGYNVTNSDSAKQGGYNVHYSLNKSGPPYDVKATVSSTLTSTVISGLTTTASPPAAPTLALDGFASQTLLLSWSTSSLATKYIVYYTDTTAATPEQSTEVGSNVTFPYALTGLVNLHHYSVAVTAVAQPTYHFSVTAFDYTVAGAGGDNPGVSHESEYSSPEVPIALGSAVESSRSNALNPADTYPESINTYPALPNSGCFIATAAYGSYSASPVQALREFRDRYLVTTASGRAFVSWYYTYGPRGAQFLNEHPEWKPVVRAALLPAVGVALFLTHTSSWTKVLVVLMIGMFIVLFYYRKKLLPFGGLQ